MIHFKKLIFIVIFFAFTSLEASFITELQEEAKDSRATRLHEILSYADQFIAFSEDYKIYAENFNREQYFLSNRPSIISIKSAEECIDIALSYRQNIEDILRGEKSINAALFYFLSHRLAMLSQREKAKDTMFQAITKYRSNPELYRDTTYNRVAYTHPENIAKHYGSDPVMQEQAKADTTVFQFSNKLILSLYELATPNEMTEKTRFYIRLSPTLWSLLSGETDDLGHPDGAIYVHESDPAGKMFDLDFYQTYGLKNETIDMPLLGYAKGKSIPIKVSEYERSQVDPTYKDYKKINALPYPDWLKSKQVPTHAVSKVELSSSSLVLSSHTGQTTSKEGAPKQDQQKPSASQAPVLSSSSEKPVKQVTPLVSQTTPLLEKNIDILTEDLSEISLNDAGETSSGVDIKTHRSLLIPEPEVLKEQKPSIAKEDPKKNQHISLATTSTSETTQEVFPVASSSQVVIKDRVEYLPPRGMRLFHGADTNTYRTLITGPSYLGGKHWRTYEAIFDYQAFQNVCFGQIKALWHAINGPDSVRETSGSSHKALLDADGRVVAGTFAHGNAMTYSKKTIPYIRDAFTKIGFGFGQQ